MITTTITVFLLSLWKIILYWVKGKTPIITKVEETTPIELPIEAKVIVKPSESTKKEEVKVTNTKATETKPIEVKKQPQVKVEPKIEKIEKKVEVKPETKKSQLVLTRITFTDNSTIGELTIDGKFICYILEDKDRKLESGGKKIFGETAIPRGTYEIIINWSNRFQRQMPLLLNVPQFEGIRIHGGKDISRGYVSEQDTHGCLIPCFKTNKKYQNSKEATRMVTEIIAEKLKKEKVYITIK